jgi:hypothetical protein
VNERIREVWIKAASEDSGETWDSQEQFIERFGKLIVRECMACSTWVGKMNTNSVEPVHTSHAVNQRIKQQFGVEE